MISASMIEGNTHHSHEDQHHEEHEHRVYHTAAVAAGHKSCSHIGVNIMRNGGNAVDAAIATMLCQGIRQPQFSGIGGGFFMTIYNATTNTSTSIDARETAPLVFPTNISFDILDPILSIGVPGELKGIQYAYDHYGGGVSWSDLFEPAIDMGKDDVVLGDGLTAALQSRKQLVLNSRELCDLFCNEIRDDVKSADDLYVNKKLIHLLEKIQHDGVDTFYNGDIMRTLVAEIQSQGGILTEEDFQNYTVIERETSKSLLPSNNYTIHSPPAPSGGPLINLIMAVTDQYSSPHFADFPGAMWHRIIETFKHAFGFQTQLGDPAFTSAVAEASQKFLSEPITKMIKGKIVENQTFEDPSYYGSIISQLQLEQRLSGGSHISILSPTGDAVSVTSSINSVFGAGVISNSTGVIFNNQLMDFTVGAVTYDGNPPPNMIAPGKRPQSSMCPTIVTDQHGVPTYIIGGAAGGTHTPTSVASSLIRMIYMSGYDFDDAIVEKRLHHGLFPNLVQYESGFDQNVVKYLQNIGHKVSNETSPAYVNGIKNHGNHIHAYSDKRNIGAKAEGF